MFQNLYSMQEWLRSLGLSFFSQPPFVGYKLYSRLRKTTTLEPRLHLLKLKGWRFCARRGKPRNPMATALAECRDWSEVAIIQRILIAIIS